MSIDGSGHWGSNGARVWWPAGFEHMRPSERVAALERGWWRDGEGHIVTADGRVMVEGGKPEGDQ